MCARLQDNISTYNRELKNLNFSQIPDISGFLFRHFTRISNFKYFKNNNAIYIALQLMIFNENLQSLKYFLGVHVISCEYFVTIVGRRPILTELMKSDQNFLKLTNIDKKIFLF